MNHCKTAAQSKKNMFIYCKMKNKLYKLEVGLNKLKDEFGVKEEQIDNIKKSERHRLERQQAKAFEGQYSQLSADNSTKCTFRTDIIPKPDIQVNDI